MGILYFSGHLSMDSKLKKMRKNKDSTIRKKNIWQDARFSHLVNDPRFHGLAKTRQKVKVDRRFRPMFSDDKFRLKYSVDKYGRKVNKSSAEDLQKYYKLESSSSDQDEEQEEVRKEEMAIAEKHARGNENDQLVEGEGVIPLNIIKKLQESDVDYARGEGCLITDSSSDEESSEEDDEMFIEHVWGELDHDAPRANEITHRLAACNMDWDHIRASDIMVLCNSFCPPNGSILSVKIYPSEFGKHRMAEEDVHGPPELTKVAMNKKSDDSNDEFVKHEDGDEGEGSDYNMEHLRQYQLNRLKYYYAVIDCDSAQTADKIYTECDGLEYESTATKFDLRFIPDDITFDEDEPKDICTETPDRTKYKPRVFTTTALQQVKVDLTWDETTVERKELGEKLCTGKIAEINDADLRKVIAYSSEEDEVSDEYSEHNTPREVSTNPIEKYKSLLQAINKAESEKINKKYEMEYTWAINVENKKQKAIEKEDRRHLTAIDKVLLKRSEKNRRRKEEQRKKRLGYDDDDGNSSDDMPSDIDLNDTYFTEEFANGDFESVTKTGIINKSKEKDSKNEEECKQKRKELELLLDDCQEDKHHFSMKKIQEAENTTKSKKRRKNLKKSREEIIASKAKTDDDDFKVNLNDSRFNAVYTSHLFSIDPTDPHYKKTKGMEAIMHEKLKRRNGRDLVRDGDGDLDESETLTNKQPRKNIETSMLIKNIKNKLKKH